MAGKIFIYKGELLHIKRVDIVLIVFGEMWLHKLKITFTSDF